MIINECQLSTHAKTILDAATQTVKDAHRRFVATEDIVMALCADPTFVAPINKKIAFANKAISNDVAYIVDGPDENAPRIPRLTPRLLTAIELANGIARELGSSQIEPIHLLLGILSDDSATTTILNFNGIAYDNLLEAITPPTAGQIEMPLATSIANAS